MTESLIFNPAGRYESGTVYSILASCYAGILDPAFEERLRQFDREVFQHPDTIGACTLVTSVGRDLVGLVSYDPRPGPRFVLIGHNGIVPAHRGRGYGTKQILELLRVFRTRGFHRARVSTSEHPFYQPARRMYQACGFRESSRTAGNGPDRYDIIHYERSLADGWGLPASRIAAPHPPPQKF